MSEDNTPEVTDLPEDAGSDAAADATGEDWAAAFDEQEQSPAADGLTDEEADEREPEWLGGGADPEQAQPMPREEFTDTNAIPTTGEEINLEMVLDVPVTISMEIGRTRIPIRNLLQLNQGSVVELDRLAGEPLNVLVNGTLIAHGEVVVVNEKFGIRLTDVISPSERIRKLNK